MITQFFPQNRKSNSKRNALNVPWAHDNRTGGASPAHTYSRVHNRWTMVVGSHNPLTPPVSASSRSLIKKIWPPSFLSFFLPASTSLQTLRLPGLYFSLCFDPPNSPTRSNPRSGSPAGEPQSFQSQPRPIRAACRLFPAADFGSAGCLGPGPTRSSSPPP
jgi:hypothetical protein